MVGFWRTYGNFLLYKYYIMKYLISSILFVLFIDTNAQEFVSNIRISQIDNSVIIKYDLNSNDKVNKFNVNAYYSTDDGLSFKEIFTAKGAIGNKIRAGKDLEIIWNPLSQLDGIIGGINIKIVATPFYPNKTFAISYLKGVAINNINESSLNKIQMSIGLRSKNKNSGFISTYLGLSNSKFNDSWTNNYSSKDYSIDRYYNLTGIGLSSGIGYITKNKTCSFYFGGGICFEEDNNETVINYIDGNKEQGSQINKMNEIFFEAGTSICIYKSICIPVEISTSYGELFISAGLKLQF